MIICAKFGWNRLCGSEEEAENVKSLRQWQSHQLRQTKPTWGLGSGELKRSWGGYDIVWKHCTLPWDAMQRKSSAICTCKSQRKINQLCTTNQVWNTDKKLIEEWLIRKLFTDKNR